MDLTEAQCARIARLFPQQRGNMKVSNWDALKVLLCQAANGCVWRALPARFGRWHTVYMRLHRWAQSGVLGAGLELPQQRRPQPRPAQLAALVQPTTPPYRPRRPPAPLALILCL